MWLYAYWHLLITIAITTTTVMSITPSYKHLSFGIQCMFCTNFNYFALQNDCGANNRHLLFTSNHRRGMLPNKCYYGMLGMMILRLPQSKVFCFLIPCQPDHHQVAQLVLDETMWEIDAPQGKAVIQSIYVKQLSQYEANLFHSHVKTCAVIQGPQGVKTCLKPTG